jgi:sugar phosphate isomerase/epimerase
MEIQYTISTWNYWHYAEIGRLETEVERIRALGYGIELWSRWPGEEDLFAKEQRERLTPLVRDMPVSLHSAIVDTFPAHARQIETAQALGAAVIVVHADDLCPPGTKRLDEALARDVVAYGAERGVRIALENGQLPFLVEALAAVDGLGVCLDIGHVYLTPEPLERFLDQLKSRLIHLHLQDVLSEAERDLPGIGFDHYMLGSGGIPPDDWALLAETLRGIDYRGMAVFEIRPRHPLQSAVLGTRFVASLIDT